MNSTDDIQNVDDIPRNLVTVIYGPEGVGKTILAASLGDNNLIVATERSNVSLSNFPELTAKTRILKLKRFDRFTKLIAQIFNGEVVCDHLIIDTFPALCDMKLSEQLKTVQFNRKHPDVNSLEDYQLLREHMKAPIKQLVGLDISVTFIAHERIPEPEGYSRGDRLTRPNVPFRVFQLVNGYTNLTAYMHKVKKDKEYVRALRTESTESHVAKTHIPMGPIVSDTKFIETIRNWKGI
ncbi:AAA family ATPase [Streptomyces hebeiensis]